MLLLEVFMLFVLSVPSLAAVQDTGYSDVNVQAWYADAAVYCREYGLMNGTAPGIFSPDETMTRAMLVSTLYRLNGSPLITVSNPFNDVPDDTWYSDAVIWAQHNGVVSGYHDDIFAPDDAITREQIAAILWRNVGRPKLEKLSTFADKNLVSDYAVEAVSWAEACEIVSGKEGNYFDPQGNATRAEVAAMLYRWIVAPTEGDSSNDTSNHILIAYFSHTGNTAKVAETLAEMTGGDLFEMVPENAYPTDYNAHLERAQQELNADARPKLSSHVENMDDYDVVLLGFPIWHGNMPMLVRTFLEAYDFSDKRIIPFSTSGSSGIGMAMDTIRNLCPKASVSEGLSITSSSLANMKTLAAAWVDSLNIQTNSVNDMADSEQLKITIGDTVLYATLEDNITVKDFLTMLPLTQSFSDYNNTEKISHLSRELQIDTNRISYLPQAGDLCLYIPWGNLGLFYQDFHASDDLVPIAHLTSRVEKISQIEENTEITIELAE